MGMFSFSVTQNAFFHSIVPSSALTVFFHSLKYVQICELVVLSVFGLTTPPA